MTLALRPEEASDVETCRRSLAARKEERAAAREMTVGVPVVREIRIAMSE
jgi:hypothetical protein